MLLVVFLTVFNVALASEKNKTALLYHNSIVESKKKPFQSIENNQNKGKIVINYSSKKAKKGPFFYILKKDNKTSYALGTQHIGVSLNELQCNDTILNHLTHANKVFMEYFPPASHDRWVFVIKIINKNSLSNASEQHFKHLDLKTQNFFREKIYNTQLLNKKLLPYIEPLEKQSILVLHIVYDNICSASAPQFFEQIKKMPNMDSSIRHIAQEQNIPYAYLDTEEFIENIVIDQLQTKPTSLNSLVNLIQLYSDQCNDQSLYPMYKKLSSDIKTIKRNYIEGTIKFPQYSNQKKRELFWNRDQLWVEKIEKAHQETGNIFIATGFLHFISDYNLLDRLKEKGFSVNRLNHQCQPEKL